MGYLYISRHHIKLILTVKNSNPFKRLVPHYGYLYQVWWRGIYFRIKTDW